MAHLHDVRDADTHFVIDSTTREITNKNSQKKKLMKGDHNSEILTFQIKKSVEGHDMSLCNRVEIHFNNVSSDKLNRSSDVYIVKEIHVDEKDSGMLAFNWLISGNATKYAGLLSFRIRFGCVDENNVWIYKWHTKIFNGITVSDGFDNTEAVFEEYADAIAEWEARLEALETMGGATDEQVATAVEKYLERNPIDTGVQFETDNTLTLKDGILSVNTTDQMEQDNTLPMTSAGVYTTVGNIEALLKTI